MQQHIVSAVERFAVCLAAAGLQDGLQPAGSAVNCNKGGTSPGYITDLMDENEWW